MIILLCSVLSTQKKGHENKQGYRPSCFYKGNYEHKMSNMSAHNMYFTNIKWPKKNWVPKAIKSNYDAEMPDN